MENKSNRRKIGSSELLPEILPRRQRKQILPNNCYKQLLPTCQWRFQGENSALFRGPPNSWLTDSLRGNVPLAETSDRPGWALRAGLRRQQRFRMNCRRRSLTMLLLRFSTLILVCSSVIWRIVPRNTDRLCWTAPHVGHFYTMVIADIIKRWRVLLGEEDAQLLTGTDEHGMKVGRLTYGSCARR